MTDETRPGLAALVESAFNEEDAETLMHLVPAILLALKERDEFVRVQRGSLDVEPTEWR